MSTYVNDAGSRYIVKDENLEEAYRYLEHEGEFAFVTNRADGCTWHSPMGFDEMWCGYVSHSYADYCAQFMDLYCESGSYACFRNDDELEYTMVWKEGGFVQIESIAWENPFSGRVERLEQYGQD